MSDQFNKQLVRVAVFAAMALSAESALASATFTNHATLNFSVAGISTAASDYSGLTMTGSFLRSGDFFPVTWSDVSGDGSVTDNNPEIPSVSGPVIVGSTFSHNFALSGNVSNGTIDLNQVGWYDLGFTNSALETFDITLNYSFEIASNVAGQEGATGVSIEYFDDRFEAWAIDDISTSSALPELASASKTFSGQFTFTLNPFTGDPFDNERIFYVNIGHTANLTAAPVPVPVPSATWLFVSGLLGIFGLKKRRAAAV